jgi:pyruvate-ferredoxin/flavodoxin oxidoreductase
MWFRKAREETEKPPYPGARQALDGQAAAFATESLACDALIVQCGDQFAELTGPLSRLIPDAAQTPGPAQIRHTAELRRLAGLLTGASASGLRASAFVSEVAGIQSALRSTAGKRLACVVNLISRASPRHAGALHGGHDEYYAAANLGLFQLFASDAQQAADLSLIAHRVAELSLTPGLCAQDYYRTSQSVQRFWLPEPELVAAYLGDPEDVVDTPTPAQEILFGSRRRRVPCFVDPDHPLGIGGTQGRDSFFRALVAQHAFFDEHLDSLIERSMSEFAALTGRQYAKVSGYEADDAEFLVLAHGAVVEDLRDVVAELRAQGVKAGVLNLTVLRPFPGRELTRYLGGKRAVTVLERTDASLAGDPPLLQEVRGAVEKARENGAAQGDELPYPGYASYRDGVIAPAMYSGTYGVGAEIPAFEELIPVFLNMREQGARRRRFYVGAGLGRASRRFPQLQALQQTLDKAYPRLSEMSLAPEASRERERSCRSMRLQSQSLQGGLFAGNLFARVLAGALGRDVRTIPSGGLERNLAPAALTLLHAEGDIGSQSVRADTVVDASEELLARSASALGVEHGGTAIVASAKSGQALWASFSRRTEEWVRDHGLELFAVDAQKIAAETASQSAFVDQLGVWVLLGAYLQTLHLSGSELERFDGALGPLLAELFGAQDAVVGQILTALQRGRGELEPVPWQTWPTEDRAPVAEPEPPWTIQSSLPAGAALFDPTRFWHSVGYLYDSGQPGDTLVDPFLATGALPAGSSAHRDMTPYRARMPEWLAENCTGCGLCWVHCPDSALPPTIQSVASVLDTAMGACKREGIALTQLTRIHAHLVKQAHQLVAKDGLNRYQRFGPLLADAFEQVVGKMGVEGEKLDPLKSEFESVRAKAATWPFSRTEMFFDAPENARKGDGMLLTIGLNPLACKACGLCIEVCPDGAIDWTEQSAERLRELRRDRELQMSLPAVPQDLLQSYYSPAGAEAPANRLLDHAVYHSMVGGDVAFPGNSAKTAVHLITASIESVMRQRFRTHAEYLSQLIERLQGKIQGSVADVVQINDFEDFGRRLSEIGTQDPTPEVLTRVFGGDQASRQQLAPERLLVLTNLLAELEKQRKGYLGEHAGRARMLITLDPSGATLWSGTYPDNPHASPWISQTAGDAPALAEGVFDGVARRVAGELAVCRRAELHLKGRYEGAGAEAETALEWETLTEKERQLVPTVLVISDARTTRREDVTRLLAARFPIRVAILDTRGLSIADGDAPAGTDIASHGLVALAQGDAGIVQASIGNPGQLIRGVADSLQHVRPSLYHVLAPDAQANGIAAEKVAEQAALAYRSRAFPLFEFDPQTGRLNIEDNPEPDSEWATHELTFEDASGFATALTAPLTVADWAIHEARFREHFKIIAKGHLNDQARPLAEYLRLAREEREGLTPYIRVADAEGHEFLATVSAAMVAASERTRRVWAHLRQLAGVRASLAESAPAAAEAETRPGVPGEGGPTRAAAADSREALTERLLWLCGYTRDPSFFKQSLREFVLARDADEPEKPKADESTH